MANRDRVALAESTGLGLRRKTLGDCFDLQRGTTYKGSLLGQGGTVLLGLASIRRNGGFRDDNLRFYGGECPKKLLVHPGELYVSLKDVTQSADLLGAVARLPQNHPPGRLTQDTVRLVPKRDHPPLDYVHWLLRTPEYRHYCRARATGTTNLGLPREDFLAYPVPALTQKRRHIVDALNAIDDKIELNRRMNETLEAMARAIFKDWFVDFGPTRAKAEGRAPYLPADLWDLFPDALDDEGKPTGWSVTVLSAFADINAESWSKKKSAGRGRVCGSGEHEMGKNRIDSAIRLGLCAEPGKTRSSSRRQHRRNGAAREWLLCVHRPTGTHRKHRFRSSQAP